MLPLVKYIIPAWAPVWETLTPPNTFSHVMAGFLFYLHFLGVSLIVIKMPCVFILISPYFSQIKSGHGKGPPEFEKLRILQDLSGEHVVCKLYYIVTLNKETLVLNFSH